MRVDDIIGAVRASSKNQTGMIGRAPTEKQLGLTNGLIQEVIKPVVTGPGNERELRLAFLRRITGIETLESSRQLDMAWCSAIIEWLLDEREKAEGHGCHVHPEAMAEARAILREIQVGQGQKELF